MSEPLSAIQRRIRFSGLFILVGLGIEFFSLLWRSPLSFFVFMIFGGALIVVGIVAFLLSLVGPEARSEA